MEVGSNRRLARNGGFTLLEVMVTLVIAAILAGITVPTIIPMWQQQRTTERQANAELIYTTAQNNMAKLKAKGLLSSAPGDANAGQAVKEKTPSYLTLAETIATTPRTDEQAENNTFAAEKAATDVDDGLRVLSSDDTNAEAALNLLVPGIADQVSDVGFGGLFHASHPHYCIEINPTTGYVYGAFYSEDQDNCNYRKYQDDAAKSASAVRGDDHALAEMNVAYYGGGKPTTFDSTDDEQIGYIGYFEFSGSSDSATVTGGYSYRINKDYSISDTVVNTLSNDNEINEGAVESSDGTAYGVLVEKKLVDENKFIPPSDVYPAPYTVTVNSSVVGKTNAGSYCFYKLDAPTNAGGHQATYVVNYDFYYMNQGKEAHSFTWSDNSHTAAVGSTARVTNELVGQMYNGEVWNEINGQDKYRIDLAQSTLSGRVKADGSLVLTVHLVKDNPDVTATQLPDATDENSTVLANGVGTWYPWAGVTSAPDKLKQKAFYVNQNFAGAIYKDANSAGGNDYQVRTDDQLQHIGSPYGSTQSAPNAQYLSGTFHQTHSIEINGTRDGAKDVLWHPIGQEQASSLPSGQKPQFTGIYDGDGNTISLTSDYKLSNFNDDGSKANENEAYATTSKYHSFGIFGYVAGAIKDTNVSVGSGSEAANVNLSLGNPHYGTLVGDLNGGTVSNSHVSIQSSSSLHVGSIVTWNNQNTVLGGLCGRMSGTATLSDSTLSLKGTDINSSVPSNQNSRLQLEADSSEDAQDSLNVGGLVGEADCNSTGFLKGCSISLDGAASISGAANHAKTVGVGGLIGQSTGTGSILKCRVVTNNVLSILSSPNNTSAANAAFGGLVGRFAPKITNQTYQGTGEKAVPEKMAIVDSEVSGSGALTISTQDKSETVHLGGFAGEVSNRSVIQNSSVSIDKALTITSSGAKQSDVGGFIGRVSGESTTQQVQIIHPAIEVGDDITLRGTDGNDASAVGGAIGSLQYAPSTNVEINAEKDMTCTASSSEKQASTGSLVGNLDSSNIANSKVHIYGNLRCESSGRNPVVYNNPPSYTGATAYAGGLFGEALGESEQQAISSCTSIRDVSLVTENDSSISAFSLGITASGGIAGHMDSTFVERASFAESSRTKADDHHTISISAINNANWGNNSYAAGGFGLLDNASISNSYIACRNTTLNLTNKNGAASRSYTGGFAGHVTGRVIRAIDYTIDSSFINGDISSSAPTVSGFADFTDKDDKHGWSPAFTNDFVLGSISGPTDKSNVYAFIRTISHVNGVRGDYAAVTDEKGETPYKFAGAGNGVELNDEDNGTERCFIYRADMDDLTDKKHDANDGAHPASYAYLTQKPDKSKQIEVPWDNDLKTSSVLDFLGDTSNSGIKAKYGFVAGDKAKSDTGSLYSLSSTNPFPTATKDKDGNYVNYGKWIAEPKGAN